MTTTGTTPQRGSQRGLSMIGFLFVAAVLLVVAMIAFRMIPSYIEYFTIQKALEGALADSNDLSTATIRRAMDRRLAADYADAVVGKDVEVTRDGNKITAAVSWEKRLPLVSNVSILLEFDASASR
jgi:Tfp pilus assembly major pilin PilA